MRSTDNVSWKFSTVKKKYGTANKLFPRRNFIVGETWRGLDKFSSIYYTLVTCFPRVYLTRMNMGNAYRRGFYVRAFAMLLQTKRPLRVSWMGYLFVILSARTRNNAIAPLNLYLFFVNGLLEMTANCSLKWRIFPLENPTLTICHKNIVLFLNVKFKIA